METQDSERICGDVMFLLCGDVFVGYGMLKQPNLFDVQDITGNLRSVVNTPLLHQKASSQAQSAIAYQKFIASGQRATQTEALIKFVLAHPGLTLQEISDTFVYINKNGIRSTIRNTGGVSARWEDVRKRGYDTIDNKGRWSLKKRIIK